MNLKKIYTAFRVTDSVDNKDWERMLDLLIKDSEGVDIAKKIKNKDKCIARYVAGTKLVLLQNPKGSRFFEEFKDRAIDLGATEEEIQKELDSAEIPEAILKKYKKYFEDSTGVRDGFVGDIVAGLIKYDYQVDLKKNKGGRAITYRGLEAMERNGRKWTEGYKLTVLNAADGPWTIDLDAVTDEGGGPTYYHVGNYGEGLSPETKYTKTKLIADIHSALDAKRQKASK